MTERQRRPPDAPRTVPDLAPGPRRRPSGADVPRVDARDFNVPFGDDAFELEDPDEGDVPLELEGEARYANDEEAADDDPDRAAEAEAWPTGLSPVRGQFAIDPDTTLIFADYGKVPRVLLDTPLYALRVWQRRRELRKRFLEIQLEFERAEERRDRYLAELAEKHRPKLMRIDRFRQLFEPLESIQEVTTARHEALRAGEAAYQEQLSAFAAELGELEDKRNEVLVQLDLETQHFESQERDHDRALAKQKRLHIETRAITEAAKKQAPPGTPPESILLSAEQSAKLKALQTQGKGVETEVQTKKLDLEAARRSRAAVQSDLDQTDQAIAKLQRESQNTKRAWESKLNTEREGVGVAEHQRSAVLADIGRSLLEVRAVPLDAETLALLHAYDAEMNRLGLDLEVHLLALDAYDRVRYKQGLVLPLAASGGLMGLVLLLTLW